MSAQILPFPRTDTPRDAIRALLNEAVLVSDGDRVTLTLPSEVMERLYAAAVGEESSS